MTAIYITSFLPVPPRIETAPHPHSPDGSTPCFRARRENNNDDDDREKEEGGRERGEGEFSSSQDSKIKLGATQGHPHSPKSFERRVSFCMTGLERGSLEEMHSLISDYA